LLPVSVQLGVDAIPHEWRTRLSVESLFTFHRFQGQIAE